MLALRYFECQKASAGLLEDRMFSRIFYGRYGFDMLSGLLLLVAFAFFSTRHLWFIGIPVVLYVLFRIFSKNISRRRWELWKFQNGLRRLMLFVHRVNSRISLALKPLAARSMQFSTEWRQRREYKFVRCRRCKKMLRLPKNKGKIVVTCPVCGAEFKFKT